MYNHMFIKILTALQPILRHLMHLDPVAIKAITTSIQFVMRT